MKVIAVLLSLCAGTLWLLKHAPRPAGRAQGQSRLVYAHEVKAGAVLTRDDLRPRWYPVDGWLDGYSPDEAQGVIGQRVRSSHVEGAQVVGRDLEAVRPLTPVAGAVGVGVPAQPDFPKLRERDRVDVLVTVRDVQTQQWVTRTLLAGVQVLGVSSAELWLEVLQEEAPMLVQAKRGAVLGLTRRNREDCENDTALLGQRATAQTLLTGQREPRIACRLWRPLRLPELTPKQ